jgi:sortase A
MNLRIQNIAGRLKFLISLLVFFVGVFLIVMPIVPQFQYFFEKENNQKIAKELTSDENIARSKSETNSSISNSSGKAIPDQNTISIPQIGVYGEIIIGNDENILNEGFWKTPNTSTPEKGGNTVIAGHRFLYTSGPKTFYNLDKLNIGDRFIIYWDKKEYFYEVSKIFEVSADAIDIENNTVEDQVTLYTCTPIYAPKDRLVVVAKKL